MKTTRRNLFWFLAASPVTVAALTSPAQSCPAKKPFGHIENETANIMKKDGYEGLPITWQKIYNGEKFVDIDSDEGVAVLNKVLQARLG